MVKLLLYVLTFLSTLSSLPASNAPNRLSAPEQRLLDQCQNLSQKDSGIDSKNLMDLQRLVTKSKAARALYASHLRKQLSDPLAALIFAAEGFLNEKRFKEWKILQNSNALTATAEWQKQSLSAIKEGREIPFKPDPKTLFADFPACSEWDLSDDAFSCVSEGACSLAELGKMKDAFAVCDALANGTEGSMRLRAHELYADIRALNEEYKEALKCLDAGEVYARNFKQGYRNSNKKEFDAVLARYRQKRDMIKRLSTIPQPMKWYVPDLSEDGLWLLSCERQIDEGTFSQSAYDAFLKKSKTLSGQLKYSAAILLGRCARTAGDDPGKALTLLIPLVTEKAVSEGFVKDYRATFKKSMNAYREAVQKKETPSLHPLQQLQVPLPDIKNWVINDDNACVIVEIARSLQDLGKNAEAVELLLALRPKLKCADYIAATELGGCLLLNQNELKKADNFCKHAFSMIPHLATLKNGSMRPDKSGVTDRLRTRLNALQGLISYRMESAKFGEGFVVYRDAERERLEKKNFVRAYELYQRVLSVDSGVYAEAAKAYTVKCLLHFGTEEGTNALKKYIDERSKVLEAKANALKELKKARLLSGFNRKLQKSIDQNQKDLNRLRTIPFGAGAQRAAIALTEKSLAKNEFGLYRGEMLTDIGLFFADENCDFKNAETWLTRADGWFEKSVVSDANLNAFAVFGEAAAVTAPPPAPRYQDRFGNVLPTVIRPGMLFNRQTSDWYIMNQRKQVVLYLGLFAFANGKRDLALTYWEKLGTYDPYLKNHKPSIYHRLRSRITLGYKGIYAKNEEMALFKNKLRQALCIADANYQFEDYQKAYDIFDRILRNKYGKINDNQRTVLLLGKGSAMIWFYDPVRTVEFLEKHVNIVRKTKTESLYLLAIPKLLGPNAGDIGSAKTFEKLKFPLVRVVERCPNSPEAETALFMLGWYSMDSNPTYAIQQFTLYLKKYPKGGLNEMAKKFLEKMN